MVWYIFVALAFLFVFWLFYMAYKSKGDSNFIKKETELEILNGRFARGEIDELEYRRRKDELVGKKVK